MADEMTPEEITKLLDAAVFCGHDGYARALRQMRTQAAEVERLRAELAQRKAWTKTAMADYLRLAEWLHTKGVNEWEDTVTAVLVMIGGIEADRAVSRALAARLAKALAEQQKWLGYEGGGSAEDDLFERSCAEAEAALAAYRESQIRQP